MCNFFSGILKKDGTVLWSNDTDSHDTLIEKHKLNVNSDSRTWLRFEITPIDNDEKNRKRDNWRIKIDETQEPSWYTDAKVNYDILMYKALKDAFKEQDKTLRQKEHEKALLEKARKEMEKNMVVRFDIDMEMKLLKAFEKLLGSHKGISEEYAMSMKVFSVIDPGSVVLVTAKTERARRLLSRFKDPEIEKETMMDNAHKYNNTWEISKKDVAKKSYVPRSALGIDYVEKIVSIMKIVSDFFYVTTLHDKPVRIQNKDFEFLVAPVLKDENDEDAVPE